MGPESRATRIASLRSPGARALVAAFLDRRVPASSEDRSPAAQRFREMIGRDEKMLVVFEWIRTAAKSDISVLILGPTGSGKEVVARMIHELSRRGSHRLQTVNCAALPETLFESEVFGYEKGAFTGAQDRKAGRLELADKGTLFLDEIGDLSLLAQAKMLRALEERRFERLGGNEPIDVDFRLVSSTNKPLDQVVRDRGFREDLYYRVNAFAIRLPSLRERAVDVPILAQRFLERHCRANGLQADGKVLAKGRTRPAHPVSLARKHPRTGEHDLPRGSVDAGTGHQSERPRTAPRPGARRRPTAAASYSRWPTPSAITSSGCSRRSAGTRSRQRRFSRSAAARCIVRSWSLASNPRSIESVLPT